MPAVIYTAELADAVLCGLRAGRTLYEICRDPGTASERTVRQWVSEDRDGFAARYGEARAIGGTATAGRTIYSADIAQRILDQLMDGRLLTDICDEPGMPAPRTVRQWAQTDREGFAERYDRARELGADAMADEAVAIADDGRNDWMIAQRKDGTLHAVIDHEHVSRSRLRVQTRRWHSARIESRSRRNRPQNDITPDDPYSWAALLKAVDGKTRLLVPLDEDENAEAGPGGPSPTDSGIR